MIPSLMKVNKFAQIWLILQPKFGDKSTLISIIGCSQKEKEKWIKVNTPQS